jgi:hypothetical protein
LSFQNVEAHGTAGGIVKNQAEKIELQDGVESIGKLVEEELEVALLGDCFADFEESLELPHGLREGRRRGDFGSCV